MNYKNTKEGFNKLFIAAILMIISDLSGFIKDKTETVYIYISLALVICGIVAFFLNFKGLKLCALDDSGYYQAYIFSIVGLVIGLVGTVISLIFKVQWLDICVQSISNFCEFMVIWEVLMTSGYILVKKGNEKFAESAKTTAYCHLAIFIAELLLSYYHIDVAQTGETLVIGIFALIVAVVAIVAEIRYFLFIKNMRKAL